jgi:hypothetical protein
MSGVHSTKVHNVVQLRTIGFFGAQNFYEGASFLLDIFVLVLFLSLSLFSGPYFSPRRGCHRALKLCIGY